MYCDPTGAVIKVISGVVGYIYYLVAIEYLKGTPEGAKLVEWAMDPDTEAVIIVVSKNNYVHYNPETQMVYWDPKRGLMLPDGSIISPAVGLGHELRHHWQLIEEEIDPKNVDVMLLEKQVLENFENPVCIALGEPVRVDYHLHKGMVSVDSPIHSVNLQPSPSFVFSLFYRVLLDIFMQK